MKSFNTVSSAEFQIFGPNHAKVLNSVLKVFFFYYFHTGTCCFEASKPHI